MGGVNAWWLSEPALVANLERRSMAVDSSIEKMGPLDLFRIRSMRERVASDLASAVPVLAYKSNATSHDGRIDLVAVFDRNPFASHDPLVDEAKLIAGWRPEAEPRVFALDGPTSSPHRQPEPELGRRNPEAGGCLQLCLYYDLDPVEFRWRAALGVLGLFDLARRHLEAEHVWRATGRWPIPEAAHGTPRPARRDLGRLIRPDDVFGQAA